MKKIIAAILTLAVAISTFCIPVSAASNKLKVVKTYNDSCTLVGFSISSGTVYYTTDGTKPGRNSKAYKRATWLKFTKPTTLRMTVYSGGKAVKSYSEKIDVKLNAPTIKFVEKSDGKYTAKITADKGTTIYYTTNGKKPTTKSKKLTNSGKITVSSGTTVRAFAFKKGWKNSSIAEKTAPKNDSVNSDNSASSDDKEDITAAPSFEEEVLRLINIERTNCGLEELTMDAKLGNAAKERSEELSKFYSHSRPDGRIYNSIFEKYSIECTESRENIAGNFEYTTPESVVEYWMNSPDDKNNILNPDFTKIGVGYTYKYILFVNYWVLLFAD